MTEGHHPNPAAPDADANSDLWQACIDQLAQELPEQQFQTWIKPLSAQVADDLSKVTIFVANRFKMDWIRAQYSARLALLMERLTGQPVHVELALAPREAIAKSQPTQKLMPVSAIEVAIDATAHRASKVRATVCEGLESRALPSKARSPDPITAP